MIRITKQADYGIILLLRLAREPDALRSTSDLARDTRLPVPMAGKILKSLSRDGLLDSKRGAQGGYSLAREPEQITVADIVTALDGPIAVADCLDEACGCERQDGCPSHHHWRWINGAIQRALASVSLADMLRPSVAADPDNRFIALRALEGQPTGPLEERSRLPIHDAP